MTTIHLTKHHALGNDFLVLLDAPDVDLPALGPASCAIAGAASAPTGSSSPSRRTATRPG